MKILLVGEYSRLHNSLKEGLKQLGHDVTIIGSGDYFKKYPVDLKIEMKYESGFRKILLVLLYRFLGIDLKSASIKRQFFSFSNQLKGYDIVQLINESPLGASPKVEKEIIGYLKTHNKKLFLLSCGTDYLSVKYAYEKKFRYSILTPYFEGKVSKKVFAPILKYLEPKYKSLHDYVFEKIDGVIASDLDYHIPLQNHPKYLGLIPNPVNTDNILFKSIALDTKIIIFHGINRSNYYKKGGDYFVDALQKLKAIYNDRIEIISVENVPYREYINLYDKAHILLDQVLGYDQGYNALEAMAKGKVVFTGAEIEFYDYYNLEETVAINALPNKNTVAEELEQLILNPSKIFLIGENARKFVEEEHHYIKIAEKYIAVWKAN